MPHLSAWLVRLALLHFGAWGVVGSLLLASKAVALPPWLWLLRPAHVDGLLFGFVIQLAFGVALWILPSSGAPRQSPAAIAAGVLLNAGVACVAVAGMLAGAPALGTAGRLAEAASLAVFVSHAWPRVRAARDVRKRQP